MRGEMDAEVELFWGVLYTFGGLGVVTFVALLFIDAPYGRFNRPGWGPSIRSSRAWLVMEFPAIITFLRHTPPATFSEPTAHASTLILTGMYVAHYVHRSVIYPRFIPASSKSVTLAAALLAGSFNLVAPYITSFSLHRIASPLTLQDPQFGLGVLLFVSGAAINLHSDYLILELKRRSGGGYVIPYGGVFRWVSCAPYFGEIVEWAGWVVASNWAPGGVVFWLWTVANLVPRAVRTHRWYQLRFGETYTGLKRKAVIPYLL